MQTDIFEKIRRSTGGPIGQYRDKADGYFAFPKLEGELGPHMRFAGKEVLCWSLNNYLGLANHPEIRKVDGEAAARWGMAYPMGSRMMTGQTALHEKFERMLADFEKKEAAFLFNFGYQGIFSTIDSLVGRHDVIVYDAECHACLLDGIRLHIGDKFKFRHNDAKDCDRVLARATKVAEESGGGILVITEGVFGMTGALGILDEIVALKKKYSFRFMIDDAHGFGVMGPHGRGTSEHFGVMDGVAAPMRSPWPPSAVSWLPTRTSSTTCATTCAPRSMRSPSRCPSWKAASSASRSSTAPRATSAARTCGR